LSCALFEPAALALYCFAKSEADINAIYLGITADDRALSNHRQERIAELRRRLDTLDASGHLTS